MKLILKETLMNVYSSKYTPSMCTSLPYIYNRPLLSAAQRVFQNSHTPNCP